MTRSFVVGANVDIDMGANPITNVEDPTNDQDAATKKYVDDNAGGATFGTPAIVLGTVAGNGTVDEAIRRDSTIVAFDGTAPSTQAFGDAAATGSAAVAARRDHKHAMPATPTSVSGNAGTATALQTGRTIDGQTFDGTANITVIAPGTHAASSKTTPVDADELPLVDSAASNVLKKLTWANLKATAKTYFDGLYQPLDSDLTTLAALGLAGFPELVYRYTVAGNDKASIDTGADTADAGSNDWTNGDMLEVFIVARTDEVAAVSNLLVTLNNDGNNNYLWDNLQLNNTSVTGSRQAATSAWQTLTHGSGGDASTAAVTSLRIPAYAGTTFNKTGELTEGQGDSTAGNNFVRVRSVLYTSTSAITRLKIAAASTQKLKVGSQLLIYKRRSA